MNAFNRNFSRMMFLILLFAGGAARMAHAQTIFTKHCDQFPAQRDQVNAAVVAAIGYIGASYSDAAVTRWFGAQKGTQSWTDINNSITYYKAYAWCSIASTVGGAALAALGCPPIVTIDCAGGRQSIVAHNGGVGSALIYLDDGFWNLHVKSGNGIRNSQAGAIIHEISHLIGTVDASMVWNLGYVDEFQLALNIAAQNGPYTAVWNANNWEYFFQNE